MNKVMIHVDLKSRGLMIYVYDKEGSLIKEVTLNSLKNIQIVNSEMIRANPYSWGKGVLIVVDGCEGYMDLSETDVIIR